YCKVGGIARPDEKSTHWSVSGNIFGGNRAVVGPIFSKSPHLPMATKATILPVFTAKRSAHNHVVTRDLRFYSIPEHPLIFVKMKEGYRRLSKRHYSCADAFTRMWTFGENQTKFD
ncbi:MAG: hypothetical protein LBT97_05700, partial [Planctomycetota bacterium]|nr:hypothetical protein [Planctomycetota bacterium]